MDSSPQMTSSKAGTFDHLAVLALLFTIVLSGFVSVFPLISLDVWWHLKTGEQILATGSIPTTDIFTYTADGRTWITHEWLSGVLYYGLYALGGANLLVIFKALLTTAAMGLASGAALVGPGTRSRMPAVAVGVLLGGLLLAQRAYVRPHLITAFFLSVTLFFLRKENTTGNKRWLWALVPLFVLWANLHSGFVLGLGLIILFWLGEAGGNKLGLDKRDPSEAEPVPVNWRTRFGALAAVTLGTLLNPHHVHAFLYPFKLLYSDEVRGHIIELRSVFHPGFSGALFLKVLMAVGLVLLVSLAMSRRRWVLAILLPGAVFGLVALNSVRGVTEFAVLVPALIGLHGMWLGRHRQWSLAVSAAAIVLSVIIGGTILRQGMPVGNGTYQRLGTGVSQGRYPAGAVDFLQETKPTGRIFNVLGFGGYLIHELWPEQRVFIDGRLDVFPPGFLDAYGELMRKGTGWDQLCRRHGITLAVVNYNPNPSQTSGLRDLLWDDPEWTCVFFGDVAMVFARRVPENKVLLDEFACPFDPTLGSVPAIWNFALQASPDDRNQAVSAMEAMVELAPEEKRTLVALGLVLHASGQSGQAVPYLRRVVSLGPESTSARLMLAEALSRAQEFAEAETEVTQILIMEPKNIEARIIRADVQRKQGNSTGALKTLEEAVRIDPRNYFVHLRLGDLFRKQGDRARAISHCEQALKIRPGDPNAQRLLEAARSPEIKP